MRMLFETRFTDLRCASRAALAEATETLFPDTDEHEALYAWCRRSGLLRPEEDRVVFDTAA